jgi:hypothetical protein
MFFILAKSTDDGKTWTDEFDRKFETGAEAQDIAKRLNSHYKNIRWRVRRVIDTDSDNFVAREMAKNHELLDMSKLPSWAEAPYYRFAHLHPDDKTKVKFFSSVENAIIERWTVTRLTRYLTVHCDIPIENCEQFLIDIGYYSGKADFKILRNADEIESAYVNGPTSCMNDPDDYPLPDIHPARAYASPDLGLAVLYREDECVARAVVFPERKIYGRSYGHTKLLESFLKK